VLSPQPEPSGESCLILPEVNFLVLEMSRLGQAASTATHPPGKSGKHPRNRRGVGDGTGGASQRGPSESFAQKVLEIKHLTIDPGVSQVLLAHHWASPKSKLPSWQALGPTLIRRLVQPQGPHFFQINFALAGAQSCWRAQNRLGGVLQLLFKHLPRKAPVTVFHHLALQSIRTFFPYLRWISSQEKDQALPPAKSGWNLSRLIPWNIPEAPALDSYWQRVLELGQLIAQDWEIAGNWEKDASYFSSFEQAWPLIRDLNIPAAARVLDELIEERDRLLAVSAPTQVWKPLELRHTLAGIRLGSQLAPVPAEIAPPKKMDLQLVHTLVREELAEMAAGAGHEINNPLGILTGTIQKLHKDLLKISGESQQEASQSLAQGLGQSLDLMKRQVQRVRSQIESLMVFARPPEPRDSLVSVLECLELWQKEAVGQGFAVQVISESPALVRGGKKTPKGKAKPTTLKQKNATIAKIDKDLFARAGQWMLEFAASQISLERPREVRLSCQPKPNALIFEMEYHQPSPRPSQILHLFTPFFCPKGYGRSSGLHLAASRGIFEKMGGKIGLVPSQKPGWTLIRVQIPRAAKEPAPRTPRSVSSKTKASRAA